MRPQFLITKFKNEIYYFDMVKRKIIFFILSRLLFSLGKARKKNKLIKKNLHAQKLTAYKYPTKGKHEMLP
jgi:hypothetical protein